MRNKLIILILLFTFACDAQFYGLHIYKNGEASIIIFGKNYNSYHKNTIAISYKNIIVCEVPIIKDSIIDYQNMTVYDQQRTIESLLKLNEFIYKRSKK